MATKVKICGIRTVEAAHAAVTAGADFLGFNFVPTSKRRIKPAQAREIIEQLTMNVKIVGIFQNQPLKEIKTVIDELKLDFVQLHGQEGTEYAELTQYAGVIKTFSPDPGTDAEELLETMKSYDVDYYLLDRQKQGTGEQVNIQLASYLSTHVRLFLAGGLTPENVAYVARHVQPYGVDVAGGIETDGEQDVKKVRKFIQATRGVL